MNTINDGSNLNKELYDFDVLILGAGPGGYETAIKAAQMGKKVAIVEKEFYGGTCLNVGCIPTKTLLRSAEVLREVKESSKFGVVDVDVKDAKIDMKAVQKRKAQIVRQLVRGVEGLLKGNGVTMINGMGSFVDAHTVTVEGANYTAETIIVATGSRPRMLPVPISEKATVLTSTEALDLDYIPEEMIIIGGGVIGMEFAYFFNSIGTKVTVIEFLDRILPMVDEEIIKQVSTKLKREKITIHTHSKVVEITEDAVIFEKDGERMEVPGNMVLLSVGRSANVEGLNGEAIGLEIEGGAIKTNLKMETSIPNIYAIGDVNGKMMLAHTASAEGIMVVENLCGADKEFNYDRVPSAIYIQPEIAGVGMTEEQAREKYSDIRIGRFPMMANGKSRVAGGGEGMIKIIADGETGEILGIHMYCLHATEMIAEGVVAMNLEGTVEELCDCVHPHPTVSEAVLEAFHATFGKAINFM